MRRLLAHPLFRYRMMAYIVGVMLIVVFVAIPFQSVEAVIGPIHGILYIVYLVTVLNLLFLYRLRFWWFVGMVVAGFFPFLSFVMERVVTKRFLGDPTFVRTNEPI